MDSTVSPAEELRAAASLIRETAGKAAQGHPAPWHAEPDFNGWWHVATPAPHLVTSAAREPVAEWIALMSPDKAETLAAWLEREAEHAAKGIVRDWPECPSCGDGCGGHDEQDFHDGTVDRGGCNRPLNGPDDHRCACFDEPLAVARAILGRAS